MKNLLLLIAALAGSLASAQTTTISATALKDQSGALVTGSLCIGPTLYGNTGTVCQSISNGVLSSFSVANGTYAVWLNEGDESIYSVTGASLTGTAIDAGNYFLNQFAASVGSNFIFFPSISAQSSNGATIILPIPAGIACNGNAVTLPAAPLNNQMLHIQNVSTSAACPVSGNGNAVMYQAATLASPSLAAKLSADILFIQNYDFAGHNAWFVTHLGN